MENGFIPHDMIDLKTQELNFIFWKSIPEFPPTKPNNYKCLKLKASHHMNPNEGQN